MAYKFDDNPQFHETDQFIFDWARDETNKPTKRVRVQADRLTVEDNWHVPFINQAAVLARFNQEKQKHLPRLERESVPVPGQDFRIYRIT